MPTSRISILENPENVNLYDAHLLSAKIINYTENKYTIQNSDSDGSSELLKHLAKDAILGAAETHNRAICYPGTRAAVLQRLDDWAHGRWGSPILWLPGVAGAGKSAIAQTIGEHWERNRGLGAAFFFSRSAVGRNESRSFVATIAYQLMLSHPCSSLRDAVHLAASKDPLIFVKSLRVQAEKLIINPLKSITLVWPSVIIVDGLDECWQDNQKWTHERRQQQILEAIADIVRYQTGLRFLITSRPERQLRESFQQNWLAPLTCTMPLDSTFNARADIDWFLRCRFQELKEKHSFLDPSWPPESAIQHLVEKSSGCFIYPSTVMQYISNPRADPRESLENILQLKASDDQHRRPFAELDALYLHILQSVAVSSLPRVLEILGLLWHPWFLGNDQLFSDVIPQSPEFMARMLVTTVEQIYIDLLDLHSVLYIPPPNSASLTPILMAHASFTDFILDPDRSGVFHLDKSQVHLHCQLSLLKQYIISNSFHPSASCRHQQEIRDMLIAGLEYTPWDSEEGCLPSVELMKGLEATISRDERKYGQYLDSIGLAHLGLLRKHHLRDSVDYRALRAVYRYCWRSHLNDARKTLLQRTLSGVIYGWQDIILLSTACVKRSIGVLKLLFQARSEGLAVITFLTIYPIVMVPAILISRMLKLMWNLPASYDLSTELFSSLIVFFAR